MRKRVSLLICVLLPALLLGGCWDALPLEQRSVVLGVGIDLVEEATGDEAPFEFTIVTPLIDENSAYPSQVRTVRAHSLGEAVAILHHTAGRTLFLGKKGFLLFGKAAAEAGVAEHISQFYAFPEVRVNSYVAVAEDKAKDVLSTLNPNGQRIAIQIMRMFARASRLRDAPPITLAQFSSQVVTPGFDAISTILTPIGSLDPRPPEKRGGGSSDGSGQSGSSQGGAGGGGGGGQAQQYLQIGKNALWHQDRMVGTLELSEVQYLTIAKGTAHGLLVQLRLPPDERFAPVASRIIVRLLNSSPSWEASTIEGKPHFKLDLKVYLSLDNYSGEVNVTDLDNADMLETLIEKTMQQNIASALQKLGQAGCDGMALGQQIRIKFPKQWDPDKWPEMLANATYEVKTKVRIRNTGTEIVGLKSKITTP